MVNRRPTDIRLTNTQIGENLRGAEIGNLLADDPDIGDSFTFTTADRRFEIVGDTLKLREGVRLDHEATPTTTLRVTATDAGGLAFTKTLTLTVLDGPDAPTDILLAALGPVPENVQGAVVGKLSTLDFDLGDSFTFTTADRRFEIIGDTLKLRTGVALDFERGATVGVRVTATDSFGLSFTKTVTFAVQDGIDAPTDILISRQTVTENVRGAVVGTLSALDPDLGDSFTFTTADSRFEIVGDSLKLRDGVRLTHETTPTTSVRVTATDSYGLSFTKTLRLTVEDTNQAPTDVTLAAVPVAENARGAILGTLSAVDADDAALTFSTTDTRFEILGNTLKLRDTASLDFERPAAHSVRVTATDSAGQAVTKTLALIVQDVNERPTGVTLSNATVAENAAGAVVGTLAALDPHAGDTHVFTTTDGRFEILGNTLKLRGGASLDFEATPTTAIRVTATDAGGLSTLRTLTLAVQDMNDAPTGITLSAATVAENALGAAIGTLRVTDPDAVDSFTFSLSDSRFEVVDGMLRLRPGEALDFEEEPTVVLTVTASDKGGLSVARDFTIVVQDEPEQLVLTDRQSVQGVSGASQGRGTGEAGGAGEHVTFATGPFAVSGSGQFDTVLIERRAVAGNGGTGGEGNSGAAGSFSQTITNVTESDGWQISYSTVVHGPGGDGGAGGRGGAAGDATTTLAGLAFSRVESLTLRAEAAAGMGGSGASGGSGGSSGSTGTQHVYNPTAAGERFRGTNTEIGAAGGDGGAAGAAAAGGDASAAIRDISAGGAQTSALQLFVSAVGGFGGHGGSNQNRAFGAAGTTGGDGGGGGAGGGGGDALAEVTGLQTGSATSISFTAMVLAVGGTGGWGGDGGVAGNGRTYYMIEGATTYSGSETNTRGSPGDGASGGAGGDALARFADNAVTGGVERDVVTIQLFATAGGGAAGGKGAPAVPGYVDVFGEYTVTYVGRPAGTDGAAGAGGAARIEVTNNTLRLGGGDDVVTIQAGISSGSDTPVELTPANFLFTGNVLDGGNGYDVLDLGNLGQAQVVVDFLAGTISIAGSVANILTGFEEVRLSDGTVLIA